MRFRYSFLLLLCSVFLVGTFCRAAAVSRDGVPQMAIVISDAASAPEKNAAEELRAYLNRITGGNFTVSRESQASPSAAGFYVGATRRYGELFPEQAPAALPDETVVLKLRGNQCFLLGGGSRGTLYAVYSFLENHCNVRWYTPEFEVVPENRNLSVDFPDVAEAPGMEYREPCHIGLNFLDTRYYNTDQVQRFAVRMRSNGFLTPITPEWGGRDKCLPGGWPEFRKIVNPDVYFAKHPEWYAEIKGKRVPGQLCLSNREMVKTLAANLIKMIDAAPGVKHVSITQNDTGRDDYCHCSECMKLLEEEGTQSGLLLRCVNEVAEEVEKKYPGLYVNMLAYSYTLAFPKKARPRHNVSIQVCCPGEAERFDSGNSANALDLSQNRGDKDFGSTLKQWSAVSPKLYAWTYQINFGDVLLPIPNTFNLGPNIRTLAENRVSGVFAQGNAYAPIGDFVELKAWLTAKLLWNPYADDKALIQEFLEAYYGKAAPNMREYMQLLVDDYSPARFTPHNAYATPPKLKPWLTLDAMNRATELFAEAEALVADNPVMLEHVKRVKMCIDFQWLCGFDDYRAEAKARGRKFLGPATLRGGLDAFIKECQKRNVWRLCEGNGSLNILNKALIRKN